MYNDIIGILGGMGSEATLIFFKNILKSFPVEKEWDRPRIIIDNYCTMPSRVRACLYNEKTEQLVNKMVKSISSLISAADSDSKTHIIMCCNTAHLFLPQIYERLPTSINNIVNIIDICLQNVGCGNSVSLLASEGTLQTEIYQKYAEKYNIKISPISVEYYSLLRSIIEDVKQHHITKKTETNFFILLDELEYKRIILGCTELPILLDHIKFKSSQYIFYDPLNYAIDYVKKIIK